MKTAVFSSYLCLKRHPQWIGARTLGIGGLSSDKKTLGHVKKDLESYCNKWILSLKNCNVNCFIFYDSLSEAFIKKMKGVSNNLQFLKVPPGKYTNNDQRFYYYHTFLKNNLFDSVFITDLWDVQCRIDPSTLNTNEFDLFFCKDSIKLSDYDFNGFKYFDAHKIYNWENCKDFLEKKYDLLNMGVIGGSYKNIMMFLEYFKKHRDEIFTKYNDQRNINMIIGNYIARKYFNNILAGFPFCSEFKKFENRDDVYFIHK